LNQFSPTFWEIIGGGGVAIGILVLIVRLIPLLKVKNGVTVANFEKLLTMTGEQTKVLMEMKVAFLENAAHNKDAGRVIVENNRLLNSISKDMSTMNERQSSVKQSIDRLDAFHQTHNVTFEKKR